MTTKKEIETHLKIWSDNLLQQGKGDEKRDYRYEVQETESSY